MRRTLLLLTAMAVAILLASGAAMAANIVGTDSPDTIVGTENDDTLEGLGGDDTIEGLAGNDTVEGGDGADHLYGGNETHSAALSGNDTVSGQFGGDYVEGSAGADILNGGAGADTVIEGPNRDQALDTIHGGPGNDAISAAGVPASKDDINCGDGIDDIQVDSLDVVSSNCENIDVWNPDFPEETTPVPEGEYLRFCGTPRFGFNNNCGKHFMVYHQNVYVKLRDSEDNRRVSFELWRQYDENFDRRVGTVHDLSVGDTRWIWQNETANHYDSYIAAGSSSIYRTWVKATVYTTSF